MTGTDLERPHPAVRVFRDPTQTTLLLRTFQQLLAHAV